MKNFINKLIVIAAFGCFFTQNINAQITTGELLGQVNTITTAVPFLMIAPDARAGAMGDAGVSSEPDANSLHWNPAKYAFIEKDMGISISYSPWLRKLVNDINLAYVSGYKKIGKNQAIAASLLYFSLGDITFTDIVGNTIGQFKPSEYAVDLCYSRKLADHFSGGISLRYIHSNLTGGIDLQGGQKSHAGNSVATDVSVYYNKEIEISKQKTLFAFGVNISNIGAKISYTDNTEKDFIPINLRLGPSLTTNLDKYNSLGLVFDLNKLMVPTPPHYDTAGAIIAGSGDPNAGIVSGMFGSFSDAPGGYKEELREITYSVGLEYWYDKQFAVRAGYFYEHATKGNRKYFTVGAGLKYNVFGLNLAYLIPTEQHNPLENTLRFSLLFDFDAFKDQNKKTN
ncbi:MAG: type IX secretion system outer membrane channel protein PorV [Bacteroidetes bacterium]|nr:type IX secretion system outer membrane channel protein PorV [Bacteroidota bacterium]